MATITLKVTGLGGLERKLGPALVAQPARNFFNRSTITIQSAGRRNAPVDRGDLRNKIATEVDTAFMPRWGRIGTNVTHAEPQELGTRPFWPPKAPLEAWGARKGLSKGQVYLIRRKIARVGISPKLFMTDGVNSSLPAVRGFVAVMAKEIEAGARS